jgi:hypothetical protein
MNQEEIRQDLLRRAREMREMDPQQWIRGDPRFILDIDSFVACAIIEVDSRRTVNRTLSTEAQSAVAEFLSVPTNIEAFGGFADIVTYNDKAATCPTDVAVLLEKCAADL